MIRSAFLRLFGLIPFLSSRSLSPFFYQTPSSLTLPLKLLPVSGLLISTVTVDDHPSEVIIDTGSPFLTVGSLGDHSHSRPNVPIAGGSTTSTEQYGEDVLLVTWVNCPVRLPGRTGEGEKRMTLVGKVQPRRGVNTNYLGLSYDDAERPSVVSQFDWDAFVLSYADETLRLTRGVGEETFPYKFYDFKPYSSNAFYYATAIHSIQIGESVFQPSPGRDMVVVIDSGLSGIILDSSFDEILPSSGRNLTNAFIEINLRNGKKWTVQNADYYNLVRYRLPWFDKETTAERKYPITVAIGAAYLYGKTLKVDVRTKTFDLDI